MLGLAIISIFAVYVAISIFATWYVAAWARESGRRAWLWGSIAGLAMYNLMFWDLIPTLIMHRYYCSTEAGFWAYKTFEKWDSENPGIAQELSNRTKPNEMLQESVPLPENTRRHWYNVRFYGDSRAIKVAGSIVRIEDQFVDLKTGELIARSINFVRGLPANTIAAGGTPGEIRQSLVLGSGNRDCVINGNTVRNTYTTYIYDFWKSGEGR